jgi:hypothetical protein
MAQKGGLTLSDMTQFGRQAVKVIAILFVVMIVGRFAIQSFVAFWKALNPPTPPPPTVGFGMLPSIRFPDKAESELPTSYSLELAQGTFPTYGDRAKVFFMPSRSLGLLSDQTAREFAAKYGFVFEPTVLTSRLYRWQRSSPLETTLQLDIQTYQMRLTTNYLNRSDLLIESVVPEELRAEQIVKNFMNTGAIGDLTIATNSAETTYLRLQGSQLTEALSYSDADYVRVSLNRYPVDGTYRMFTPDGTGTIEAVVAGGLSGNNAIVDFVSNFHSIDRSVVHTYPIRTAAEAWSIMQAGEGYVARHSADGEAIIRSVELGYYDDFEPQQYLQPVYVFSGDDDFLGYVPAIDPRYIQSSDSLSQ